MKKFGFYLLSIIAFSTLASTLALVNQEKISEENNFLQTSLEKKVTKSHTQTNTQEKGFGKKYGSSGCGTTNYGYDACGYKPGNDCGYVSSSCGSGYGFKGRGSDSCGSGYGKYGGKYFGRGAGVCSTDGYYDRGYGFGRGYGRGYGSGYGRGYGRGYGSGYYGSGYGHGYCDNDSEGYFGDEDIFCGSGPSYRGGYARGRGHLVGRNDLRGKYLSLEDAAALLGCERERKIAASNTNKGENNAKCSDSGSKYLDKDCMVHKKLCRENDCNDCNIDSGKDFNKRKCSSADKANCDNDHHYFIKKSHSKLNCRNGKKEKLCMNTNNLDKNCSDGKLLEEFDKLEHFKKCAKGHKENLTGNDCTVKKSNNVHNCKDTHSLACHKNKKNKASKDRASADSKESCDYHEHDRRNKNSRNNKIGKECKLENDLTKAGKYDSEKDTECNRENSKGIACEKKDRLLKKANFKDINGECVDKKKCIDAGLSGEVNKESCETPVC